MELRETTSRLELISPVAPGIRVLLGLVGLLPLYAPYDLLVRPDWTGYFNAVFAFAALISAGAMAVSLGFLSASLGGRSSRLALDAASGELVHTAGAPLVRDRTRSHPLAAVAGVEVRAHDSSEREPTYAVAVLLSDGTAFETGPISSRDEAEAHLRRVQAFLSWHVRGSTRAS